MKNHSAFPHGQVIKEDSVVERCEGMTLLDYFAGQAMAGITGNPSIEDLGFQEVCSDAYGFAEAMLAEREKRMGKSGT